MIYVVLEMEDKDFTEFDGPSVRAVYKKPTQFCDSATHKGSGRRVMGFTRGTKFGWWLCTQCKKPTAAWGASINAVIGSGNNLLERFRGNSE